MPDPELVDLAFGVCRRLEASEPADEYARVARGTSFSERTELSLKRSAATRAATA